MQIMMMYLIFHAHVNCMWNFNKIVIYQIYPWNVLNTKGICKRYLPIKGKHVRIVPVYKHGNKPDPGIYGSISVLSKIHIFCKKKKMAYGRVNNSTIKYKPLCPSQYRFCKHCSSEHALLDVVGKMQKYMDKKIIHLSHFYWFTRSFW